MIFIEKKYKIKKKVFVCACAKLYYIIIKSMLCGNYSYNIANINTNQLLTFLNYKFIIDLELGRNKTAKVDFIQKKNG